MYHVYNFTTFNFTRFKLYITNLDKLDALKWTKEHNSIMFENPSFYKSLANQRFMRLLKIILLTKPNS